MSRPVRQRVLDAQQPVRLLGQPVQDGPGVGVGTQDRALRRFCARGAAAEQQPVQGGVLRGRGRHPPDHGPVACPSERHVEQPQRLPTVLVVVAVAVVGPVGPRCAADIEDPGAVVGVELDRVRFGIAVGVPPEGHVHDGELQALGAVDGHHLHGLGV